MTPTTILYPTREGWQIDPAPSAEADQPQSLDQFALRLSGMPSVELAIPTRYALFEWFSLPSTDAEELAGMAELQLEKRLPYALEETRFAHCTLSGEPSDAGESRVFAAACQQSRVDALAAPLLAAGCYPERVSFQALRIGGRVGQGTAAAIWWEESDLIFAVFETGYPLFVEVFESAEELAASATRLLMGATVAGAASAPESLWVDPALENESADWQSLFGVRAMHTLPAQGKASRFPNLVPPQWRAARQRVERRQRVLHGAKVAGVALIGVVAACFGLMAWKKQQLRNMQAELEALRPTMESLLITQARWNALAPATDSSRFTLELLHRITGALPSDKVRITSFKHTLTGFEVEGEAPSAREAVDFAEELKTLDAVKRYTLETPSPTLLPGERAQFVIRGK